MSPAKRHVPLRTCIACGNKSPKRELTRIVSTQDDGVRIDETGKLPGRGAYICRDVQCAPADVKRGRIENALRGPITDGDWQTVASAIMTRGTEKS